MIKLYVPSGLSSLEKLSAAMAMFLLVLPKAEWQYSKIKVANQMIKLINLALGY